MTSQGGPEWQRHEGHGVHIYRGDLYEVAGVRGGKARTCYALAKECIRTGKAGLVTAGSRQSPQVNLVAQIGNALALPVVAYCPEGELGPELLLAQAAGARILQVRAGYNSVIRARAREHAADYNWQHVPFGMECSEAIEETSAAYRAAPMPAECERLVVCVGSGMSLAGLLAGMGDAPPPVLGVCVGADPEPRLRKWAPMFEWLDLELVRSEQDYHEHAHPLAVHAYGFPLDPVYEAKCVPYVRRGDAFWIVGVRQAVAP